MTVREILAREKGNYTTYEVWKYKDGTHRLHTDFIENIDSDTDISTYGDAEAYYYNLFDEEDYNGSINANSCVTDDFEQLYGDKDAKVLVIMLDKNWKKE